MGKNEITLQEARDALGADGVKMTDNEVLQMVDNIQSLVKTWSENYQKSLFNGKTINDLLTLSE